MLFELAQHRPRARRRAGRARDAQHRQADRRGGVRHRRRRDLLRVLRRPRDQDPRRRHPGARQRDEPGAARADRRRRPDHPVELSAADGGVEARAGDLRRLHDGAEAGRADAAVGARARVELRRRRPAAGRRQHRDRRGRDAARRSSSIPTSTRSRSPAAPRSARSIMRARRRHAEEDLARARRQVAEHLLRRRRLRGRRRRRAVRRLHQPGRGLLGRQPHPRAAADLQAVRRRDGREGEDDHARPADGSRHEDGRRSSAASSSIACAQYQEIGKKRSEAGARAAAAPPAARSTAATSSSRRSSTTSTTRARIAREEIFGPVAVA